MADPTPACERFVWLRDLEVRQSVLPLDTLLRLHGIDPTRPYTRLDVPARAAQLFRQVVPTEEAS